MLNVLLAASDFNPVVGVHATSSITRTSTFPGKLDINKAVHLPVDGLGALDHPGAAGHPAAA